ncbi:MAG: WD40 repeat domain-containing protein [bacterium]|nr:WD40 repeat domain-containing protein [bacterium]
MKALIIFTVLIPVSAVSAIDFPTEPYSHLVPCGDKLLAFTLGLSNKFILFDTDGEVIADSREMGMDYEQLCDGSCSPDGETIAVWARDLDESDVLLFSDGGVLLDTIGPLSGHKSGSPMWDRTGDLWYVNDGVVFKDGKSQEITIGTEYFDVSPDGKTIAYGDNDGRMFIVDVGNDVTETIDDDKGFYPMAFTPAGQIIAVTSENEIWLFETDGSGRFLAEGIQPSWYVDDSYESGLEGVLFVETDDHWMEVTDSEIWLVKMDGTLWQMTNTPGIAETNPEDWNNDIISVDGITGDLVHIEQEW